MALPTNAEIDAACPPTGSTRPRSDLTNAILKSLASNISVGSNRDSASPKDYGADPSGVADATAAVTAVINAMNTNGIAGRFDGGTWRVTSALPPITYPVIAGDGSGVILVDYNPAAGAVILDCVPPIGEIYTVTAVAAGVVYDASGAFTADSLVTQLTLSLVGAQVMPVAGSVGKLTATNVIAANGGTDQVGQHVYVMAISGSNVLVPWSLYDTFSTGMQLIMLGNVPCAIEGVAMRHASYANVVANDLRFTFLRITAAMQPSCRRLRFRDGSDVALHLLGTYGASTEGIRVRHMRNATLSESPAIRGDGVLDSGSWQSVHHNLGGGDCRHVYSTSSAAPTLARAGWGRTMRPQVLGGQSHGCSGAAYDTNPDCVGAEFHSLGVAGGYLGEDSPGIGIQLRGAFGRAINCAISDLPIGVRVKKTYAGEVAGHEIHNLRYDGTGAAILAMAETTLAAVDRRQRVRVGNLHARGAFAYAIGSLAADLDLVGNVVAELVGAPPTSARAIDLDDTGSVRSVGGGKLFLEFAAITNGPIPRPILVHGNGCSAPDLDMQVFSGGVSWRGVVAENDSPAASLGEFRIVCDADTFPTAPSGGFSTNGAGNLLTAGALKLIGTIQGARTGVAKAASFTLAAFDNKRRIHCTSPITITVPTAAILGTDFECWIAADSATVILDGSGATNLTLVGGQVARVVARSGATIVYVTTATATVIG